MGFWAALLRRIGRIGAVFAVTLAGCTPTPQLPNVTEFYAKVAESQDPTTRRPLITVPGLLGTRLEDAVTGTVVWGAGASTGLAADPTDPFEAQLIALPILGRNEPLSAARDRVLPAGVLDVATPEVLGVSFDIEVYGGIRRTLQAGGFRIGGGQRRTEPVETAPGAGQSASIEGAAALAALTSAQALPQLGDNTNSFDFTYDWRQDIGELARDFHRFVLLQKQRVAAQRARLLGRPVDPETVRFDLVAHSLGALITRYYIMHGASTLPEDGSLPEMNWAGAEHFSRVIFVAPPNAGSVIAMDNLVNGKVFGPLQPTFPGALLATHPSTMQLMPRSRHGRIRWAGARGGPIADIHDPELWERYGWGLANPNAAELLRWLLPSVETAAERRELALAHQARLLRRAKQIHRALDRWQTPPAHLETFLVVGGGFRTAATAEVDRETGDFTITGVEEGDGVVLRSSVLLDERPGSQFKAGLQSPLRFDTVLFLPDEHVELTKNPVFGDNLLFWLLEQPRDADDLRDPTVPQALAAAGERADSRTANERSAAAAERLNIRTPDR